MTRLEHTDRSGPPPAIGGGDRLRVSCLRCDQLHPACDPLRFSSLCTVCEGPHPLGSLGMTGPHALTHSGIETALRRTSPGNYALGYMDADSFVVFYVGRSDSDVKERLHRWVAAPSRYSRHAPSGRASWGRQPAPVLPFEAPSLERVGPCADSSYTHFAFSYAPSAEAAFAKELRNFDEFGGSRALDNEGQPRARS